MIRPATVIPTGVEGLDVALGGGLPRDRVHLLQGESGTGKTTIGLQFALAGVEVGERSLFVTLAEGEHEIHRIAKSHGWSLGSLTVHHQRIAGLDGDVQTVLHPAEIELPATVTSLLDRVMKEEPHRLVIDSLAELRILAREERWFRQQLSLLRERLEALECTVLLLGVGKGTQAAENLVGGVLRLERCTPAYGPDRRRIHIVKMRGHAHLSGWHDVRIRTGGLVVYPRLIAAEHRQRFSPCTLSTGLAELDTMLGGGLDMGTATLLLGPTGTGKSTLAWQCAVAAAERGERVLGFVFDERIQTVLQRARGIGLELESHMEADRIRLRQVDPAELTPGELAEEARRTVSDEGFRMVLLDSLNAYIYAMPDESFLNVHLHELLSYLSQKGATSLLVGAQHGLDNSTTSGLDVSYLADTVLLLRTVVTEGTLRKALTVYKRRAGPHDTSVRELLLEPGRIRIGDVLPLRGLHGGRGGDAHAF